MSDDITLHEAARQPTAVVREQVAMDGLPEFFGRAFGAVSAALEARGMAPAGPPFALYHGKPTDLVDVEAGFPVTSPFDPAGNVRAGTLPAGDVVETVHVGPYYTLPDTYDRIMRWMADHGLRPADTMWECYLTGPDAEPSTWRTQVFWPVA
jgi:AraC family transcriptional regulator